MSQRVIGLKASGKKSATKQLTGSNKKGLGFKQQAKKKTAVKKTIHPSLEMAFRPYQPDDTSWIVDLTQKELGAIYQSAYRVPLTPFQIQQLLQMGQQTRVVLYQNKPIGYYTFFSDDSGKRHITSLVIDHSKQRKGIGTEVMRKIEDQAKQDGIRVLEVFIQATNKPCIAFSEKLGFTYAEPPYMNTICMQKFIG
ncbi:GNAT family N-acetyltransferase [Fodinisporobacter ferrooxydans]|uniref:GNAT family N-acetyltransferase n=1 Tax=Fodinisporobacter ferrooxydans TaxID=2901836 RepID=A0ABY4CJ80_9BACL|nr:GNAT family N-acetyltransferase [Alicyclobacillaceae bacterium MYW30-H2]